MSYDLSQLEKDFSYIKTIVLFYFESDCVSIKKVGEGFYGVVYLVHTNKDPNRLILKFFKHEGNCVNEYEQLNLLRKYSLLKIPDVYFVHLYTQEIPFEVMMMEFIEGINASRLSSEHPNKKAFANELVDNLIHLHSISNENGFGNSQQMFSTWKECYRNKINYIYQQLNNQKVSAFVLNVVEKSYESFDSIFSEHIPKSSLVHSDYNLWNILVDEKTAKVTAIIDPNDAGWADKEIDLFHLKNANGDRFGLLDCYQEKVKLSELFPVKCAFYWFWDDIKHFEKTGWYSEEHFVAFGNKLLFEMNKYLG